MKFLRNLLATLTGLFLFSGLLFVFFLVFISMASQEEAVVVKPNSILQLKLTGTIAERGFENPLEEYFPLPTMPPSRLGLIDIERALDMAATDPNIEGVFLQPYLVNTGSATLKAIHDAIVRFRDESGKWVVAYSEVYSEADYYLAAAADEVYLYPEGNMELNGLSQEVTFIKGTLDKLGVEPQIFRVGEYKSAIEPLIRKDMSEASREQMTSYLNAVYEALIDDVSEARGMTAEQLRDLSDRMVVRNAQDGVTHGLLDGLKYYDELLDLLRTKLSLEEGADIPSIGLTSYASTYWQTYSSNKIAVIVAEGAIIDGKGDDLSIGSETFAREIRRAREDDDIKAIVLRINSPGGSALASDVMWREVQLAAEAKPVIASMGDYAASGGYYLAMAADEIVAQPNTITGSIGIFGVLFNAQELLNDKIGVTTETVNTGELSGLFTMTRPLTEFEKSIIQTEVERGYETFTSKAAEGRGMSLEDLKAVASGRVWAGSEALEIGLVDEMGGLDWAIAKAAERAGLGDDYMVKLLPREKTVDELLMELLSGDSQEARVMQEQLGPLYPYVKHMQEALQMEGIQARMPYDIRIQY